MQPNYLSSEPQPKPSPVPTGISSGWLLNWLGNEMDRTSASIPNSESPLVKKAMKGMKKNVIRNAPIWLQGTGLSSENLMSSLKSEMDQTSEEVKNFKRFRDPSGEPLDYIVTAIDNMKDIVIKNAEAELGARGTPAIPPNEPSAGGMNFQVGVESRAELERALAGVSDEYKHQMANRKRTEQRDGDGKSHNPYAFDDVRGGGRRRKYSKKKKKSRRRRRSKRRSKRSR